MRSRRRPRPSRQIQRGGRAGGRPRLASTLAWYLAINAARLPEPKRDAIAAYRMALERAGVPTKGWWDRQLALSLLGAFLLPGWEKALGHPAELAWWVARVEEGTRWLT